VGKTVPHLWMCRGERMYSSYSFTHSALYGVEWSVLHPSRALPPRKAPPVLIGKEAGWAPEPVWTQRLEEKSFRLCRGSNLDRPVIQPVARHYTDWAIPSFTYDKCRYEIQEQKEVPVWCTGIYRPISMCVRQSAKSVLTTAHSLQFMY
jgi:hypothetical protein